MPHHYDVQPRDERGRFGHGSGAASSGQQTAEIGISSKSEDVLKRSRATAEKLGYDPNKVSVSEDTYKFTVNGEECVAAGVCYSRDDGRVVMYSNHVSDSTVDDVVAHEVMHGKYQAVLDAYAAESGAIGKLPGRDERIDPVMRPDGSLKEPYDKQFPVYNEMQQKWSAIPSEQWAREDGVSDYSLKYWQGYKAGNVSFHSAMHETLAEMARIKFSTGKFPDHLGSRLLSYRGVDTPKPSKKQVAEDTKVWRDLYNTVNKLYPVVKDRKK